MARPVSDLKSSVELLRLVRRMREEGRTLNGEPIEDAPDFCAGCATGQPTAQQAAWLRRKIEAGAEFVFSQPVFDEDGFRRLHEAAGGLGARLFVGLMPLVSRRSAQFLGAGRIPGIRVPPAVVEGISRYERADDQRRHGLEQACRLARAVAAQAAGAYVIAPFGRTCYADAAEVVRALAGARKGCGPRQ
jgi:homocysteine S-methyltransferase